MKDTAVVEPDGSLLIGAEVVMRAGFQPGDRVEFADTPHRLVVARERDADSLFAPWAGMDRSRPPMSLEELIAEQREMRGHDDLD